MQPTLPTNRPPAGSLVSCFAPPPGRVLWVLLLGLFLSSPLHLWAQTTRYVSTTGTAAASGATSWASSTTNLQGAIDYVANTAPNSGTVYVASGVYRPGGNANTNRAVSFSMANGVTIEGGYAGSGTPGTRTPLSSTLSGNIGSPGSTTDNSYHVIFNNANGLTATAVLDGFVVTGGQATASSSGDDGNGGGIFNRTVSPTLRNLRIEGNTAFNYGGGLYADRGSSNLNSLTIASNYSADHGAGIYATSHTLVATNTLIQSNTASVFPGEGSGGGLYASGGSINLTSLTVTGNSAFSGGGIYTTTNHSLTAINSLLQSNSALSAGFQGGGGLYASGGSSNLNSLTLVSNYSTGNGGGIYTASSHTLTATNSLIQSNTSSAFAGGGLFVSGGSINLTSLTIASNRANTNGGGIFAASSLTAINSIIQSNTATGSSGNGGGLYAQGGRSLLVNTLWQANNAVNLGGAAYLTSNNALTLTNNTLLGNTAARGTVIALISGASSPTATLLNTLAFGNGSAPNSVTLVGTGPTVSASYCLFETGTTNYTDGGNNILANISPFVTGSYQLSATSQAIDTGNNTATGLSLVSTDLAGGPRIVNSTVDIGVDEWSSTPTNLTLTTAVLPNSICDGATAALSVTATGGISYTYTWVAPSDVLLSGSSTSAVSATAAAGASGVRTLTVTVTDASAVSSTSLVSLTIQSSVAYVTPTGAGLQDGSSWTNAYAGTALQTAINAVSACGGQSTVYVATGLYQPGGSANSTRTTSFSIASGVRVLGGYAGSSSTPGDPGNRTAFPSSSTLTGGTVSYHVVWMQNVAAGTTLDGFVITGGRADGTPGADTQGGGIYSRAQSGSSSSPTLQNLVVTGNTAGTGGGIYALGTLHSLSATNSLLQSNTATDGTTGGSGGGVYADGGSSNLNSLTITDNRANINGGGIATSSHTLVATNSLLQSNRATRSGSSGGGLYANGGSSNLDNFTLTVNTSGRGGGIYIGESNLTATNSLIQSNTATGNSAFEGGGGLFAYGGRSNLSSLTLTGNTAFNGGGIGTVSSHTLTAANSLIQSNTATGSGPSQGGGGLYVDGGRSNLSSLTVTGNTATNGGGGLHAYQGSSNLSSLIVTGNRALTGGGIYTSLHTLTATSSLIQSNTATGDGGGLLLQYGSSNLSSLTVTGNRAGTGGGIFNIFQTLVATNSLLQSNTATGDGGGLYATNGSSNLSSLTVTSNTGSDGGGIYTGFSQTLVATNSLIQSNTATNGGTASGGSGGGLYASGGNSNLNSLTITGNRAINGGGIYTTNSHTLVAANSLLQSNNANSGSNGGGGLYADGGRSNLSSLTLTGNTAINGGGIYTTNSSLTATNSLLQSNNANNNGGGLYASGGSSNLSSLTAMANTASRGGGMYTTNSHTLVAANSLLQSNTATSSGWGGGGLNVDGGSSNLSNLTIMANVATTDGGGIAGYNTVGLIVNSLLEGNTANSSGGAAVLNGTSSLTLTNTTLRRNTAPQGAAVSRNNNGLVMLVNTLVWGNGPAANAISASPALQATYSLFETGTTGFTSDPTNITTTTSPFAGANGPALSTTSEAIDAGNNAAPGLVTSGTDLLGQPRLAKCSVDIGAVESQGSLTVVITAQPAASSAVCEGRAVSTSVLVQGSNLSYQWYRNGVTVPGQTSAVLSFTAVTATDAGSYSVVVTRACNTSVASATSTAFNLTIAPASLTLSVLPTANGSAGSGTLTCAQTSLTLTATTDAANSLTWSPAQAASTTSVVVSMSGVYSVTVSAPNGCTNTASVTVVANQSAPANATLTVGPSATLACTQTSLTLTAATSSAGSFSYAFAGPGLSSPNATAGTAVASQAGLYSVTITNLITGCTATATATVESTTAFVTASLGASNTLTCSITSATLSATATGTGSLTYTFTGPGLSGTPGPASTVTVSRGGTYTVLVSDATGCTNSATATVVSTTATPNAGISGNLNICQGAATTLTASGGVSYLWSTGAQTAAISVNTAGPFSVTVTNALGCTATTSRTTTLRSLPTVTITTSPSLNVCLGQSLTLTANATQGGVLVTGAPRIATVPGRPNTEVMLSTGPAFSYTWSTGSLGRTTSLAPTGPTVVSVQVYDQFCTSLPRSETVTALALPVVSIGQSAPGFGCGVASITLTANVPTGATYTWEDNSNSSPRSVTGVGTYGLSATATNGCSATATPVTLRQGNNTLPDVTMVFANNVTVVAAGGTATIEVPGTPGQQFRVLGDSGSSYEYGSVVDRINGFQISQVDFSTNGIFTIKRGGPFVITVRDATGCSRTVQGVLVVR